MAILVNPHPGSIVSKGSILEFVLTNEPTVVSIWLRREGFDDDLVFDGLAAPPSFRAGYSGTYTDDPAIGQIFQFKKNLGWLESSFQILLLDGLSVHTFDFLTVDAGAFPPFMQEFGTGTGQGGGTVGHQHTLDGLSDVNAPSPGDADVLGYDMGTGQWTPRAPTTPGAHVLDSHTDVTITGPQNDEVLTYQAGAWVNQAAPGGGTVASAPLVSYDVVDNDSTPAAGFVGVISTGGFANVTALHFADEDIEGITVAPFWAEIEAGNIITLRKEDDYTIAGQFVVAAPTQDNDRTTFNVTSVLSASGDPATGNRMNVYVTGVGATLDRVITHTPDNDLIVPSSAPIILRDGGAAFTPLNITTTSTDINAHPLQIGAFTNNAIRITQDAVAGHLLIGRNDIQATSTTAGFDITMSGGSDPVQGDLGIHGGDSSASSGKAGNVRINGGYSVGAAAGGDVRIEAGTGGTPGEIRFSQGISIVQSADHPFPTPTTSRGQYWVRSGDGKPMFTTSAGTDYDLTAGGTGGNVNFTTGSVVDNQIVRYDANGNQIQGGTNIPTIDDTGNITSLVGIECQDLQVNDDCQINGDFSAGSPTGTLAANATGAQVTGNIEVTGTVDGVDVAQLKTDYDAHDGGTSGHPNFSTTTATAGFAPGSSGQTTYFLRGDGQWAAGGPGSTTFIDLTDTDPTTYVGQAGKVVQVNTGATGLEFGSVLSNPTFSSIGETPNSMAGRPYHGLRVNGGESSLEYVDNWPYGTAPPSTEVGLRGSVYIDYTAEKVYMQTSDAGRWTLLNSGGGTVDTSGTPVDNDFARFTDANTIEGRDTAEVIADLGLAALYAPISHEHSAAALTSGTLDTARIAANALGFNKIETVAEARILGRRAGVGAGTIEELTNADVNAITQGVTGPASAVASNVPSFSGTTGKAIDDSGVSIASVNTAINHAAIVTGNPHHIALGDLEDGSYAELQEKLTDFQILLSTNTGEVAALTLGTPEAGVDLLLFEDVTDGVKKKAYWPTVGGGSATLKVRCATTANITIATALNSGDSIDGVTLADGNRVLVKNQTTATENGIYVVAASPARASDFDTGATVAGELIVVKEGTTQADSFWLCTNNDGSDVVGTNNLAFEASILGLIDAGQVSSGTFDNARVSQGNVTQHVAAIDHDSLLNFSANEHRIIYEDISGNLNETNYPVADNNGNFFLATNNRAFYYCNGSTWEYVGIASTTFLGLTDTTPTTYTGQTGKFVAVNATEDGLEFVAAGTGNVTGDASTTVVGELAAYSDTDGKNIGNSTIKINTASAATGTRVPSNSAALVGGYIGTAGSILANGPGAIALGGVTQSAGTAGINGGNGSADHGAMATGGILCVAAGTATITAGNPGARAHGYIFQSGTGTASILANGNGAFAQGYVTDGQTVTASADNSFQFGVGTNAKATSLQVGTSGTGIRLIGSGSAPDANGEIACVSGITTIRSNGSNRYPVAALTKTLTVEDPVAETVYFLYTPVAITLSQVRVLIQGGTSIPFSLLSGTTYLTTVATNVDAQTANNTTTGADLTIANTAVAAGSHLWVTFGTPNGTQTLATCTIRYTEN